MINFTYKRTEDGETWTVHKNDFVFEITECDCEYILVSLLDHHICEQSIFSTPQEALNYIELNY